MSPVWIASIAAWLAVLWNGRVALLAEGPAVPWALPALGSVLFFAFSAVAMVTEGPMGFGVDHTRDLWGNQIWMDLLLATSVGWALIAPRARAVGMPLAPWLLTVIATGSIGFLAMAARLLWLEERAAE
jgi:hypothetical protein